MALLRSDQFSQRTVLRPSLPGAIDPALERLGVALMRFGHRVHER